MLDLEETMGLLSLFGIRLRSFGDGRFGLTGNICAIEFDIPIAALYLDDAMQTMGYPIIKFRSYENDLAGLLLPVREDLDDFLKKLGGLDNFNAIKVQYSVVPQYIIRNNEETDRRIATVWPHPHFQVRIKEESLLALANELRSRVPGLSGPGLLGRRASDLIL